MTHWMNHAVQRLASLPVAAAWGTLASGLGCASVDETIPIHPEPPVQEASFCQQAKTAIAKDRFTIQAVGTAMGLYDFQLFGETQTASSIPFMITFATGTKGTYPSVNEYALERAGSLRFEDLFLKPEKDDDSAITALNPKYACSGIIKNGIEMERHLHTFLSRHAQNFVALRPKALIIPAGQATPEHELTVRFLASVPTIKELSKALPSTDILRVESFPYFERAKKLFANVGMEYVDDVANKKKYYAIYHHYDDIAAGKPPRFFAAYDYSANSFYSRYGHLASGGFLWIHNYNEQRRQYYVSGRTP